MLSEQSPAVTNGANELSPAIHLRSSTPRSSGCT